MGLMAPETDVEDIYAEPSVAWVAKRFGLTFDEAEWVLVLYRFQALYPNGPLPGRFFCEAL